MTEIRHDPETDEVWIEGHEQTFARRSLVARRDDLDASYINVRLRGHADNIVWTRFDRIRTKAGTGFASVEDTLTYLNAEFTKTRLLSVFLHTQDDPAPEWIVNHNLGLSPTFVVVTTLGGAEMHGDIIHLSINQLRVAFNEPTAGQLRCL